MLGLFLNWVIDFIYDTTAQEHTHTHTGSCESRFTHMCETNASVYVQRTCKAEYFCRVRALNYFPLLTFTIAVV